MIYALAGLAFGLFIPYIARRFAKFMPATLAYGLYRILRPSKKVASEKRRANWHYAKMLSQYRWRSIMWGVLTAGLSFFAYFEWGGELIWWKICFIWVLLLLAEIDIRMQLLPDILTIPLLLLGFAAAAWVGLWVTPFEAASGAMVGYFMPVAVSLLFVWKNQDAFGGGDIKLLAAIGAWFGIEELMMTVVLACVVFGVYAAIVRKRQGAFGPAIVVGALATAFYYF